MEFREAFFRELFLGLLKMMFYWAQFEVHPRVTEPTTKLEVCNLLFLSLLYLSFLATGIKLGRDQWGPREPVTGSVWEVKVSSHVKMET